MDTDEKRKIKTLLKEKDQSEGKLQWMYKGDKPDSDEYLLGKRIDRHIEQDDKPATDDVGALFAERIQANIAMDMASKAREDPLFAIRKKEEDVKRKILENPVKMKRLQKQLEERRKKSQDKDDDSDDDLVSKYLSILQNKQKSSSHKKKKHKRKSSDKSDSDASNGHVKRVKHKHSKDQDYSGRKHKHDSDESYKRKTEHNHEFSKDNRSRDGFSRESRECIKMESRRHRKSNSEDEKSSQRKERHKHDFYSENDSAAYHQHSHYSHHKSSKKNNKHSSEKHSRDHDSREKHKSDSKHKKYDKSRYKHSDSGDDAEQQPIRKRHDSDSDSEEERRVPAPRKYGLIKLKQTSDDDGENRPRKKRSQSPRRSRSPVQKVKKGYNRADFKPRKLTEEEKQKRLEEMMDNAKWREENRTMNIKHYKEQDKKEQEGEKSESSGFLNFMMSRHAEHSSVEDRIKRNRYNIQRTKVDLDKNFLKK